MIRNETWTDGVCVEADIIDLDAGTRSREVDGKVIDTRRLTTEEIIAYTPPVILTDAAAKVAGDQVDAAIDTLGRALDPAIANPTTAQRLVALETLVAQLLTK